MAKKKQIENKLDEFKNISNDKNVVAAAEMRKEKNKKKQQDKIKEFKEQQTSNTEMEIINVEEVVNSNKIEELITNSENVLETPIIQTIEDVLTHKDIIETPETIVETSEIIVETKNEPTKPKNIYNMRRMVGYDWMGVVYEE